MPASELLLDGPAMGHALARMAADLVDRLDSTRLVLVGIQRRGVQLADRLAPLIEARIESPLRRGMLDITLYRDDLQAIGPRPMVRETRLPPDLDGSVVVIVDDVLFTGRTVRAALDEIADFGRPRRIMLAVLVDRGGRELPIAADVAGLTVETTAHDHVEVRVQELDGSDGVELVRGART